MANNRMYLVNKKTGKRIYLAKYYPSTGWFAPDDIGDRINDEFDESDFSHLSPEEQKQNKAKQGFGPPFANGGMYGDDWELEYEQRTERKPDERGWLNGG